jgi:hypothetical protein
MPEETLIIVKSFCFGGPSQTTVVTVPKKFGMKKGRHYSVTKDQQGRIIYTPVPVPKEVPST